MLRTLVEVFGIFTVSMIVLFIFYMIPKRATGIGWLHWKGFVLMGVGVLYIVCGAFLTRVGR